MKLLFTGDTEGLEEGIEAMRAEAAWQPMLNMGATLEVEVRRIDAVRLPSEAKASPSRDGQGGEETTAAGSERDDANGANAPIGTDGREAASAKTEPDGGARASQSDGYSCRTGGESAPKAACGLEVSYDGAKAVLTFGRKVEFYRALGLLAERIEAEAEAGSGPEAGTPAGTGRGSGKPFHIKETPAFDMTGVMLDCSRNAVPKAATIRRLLRTMALMGLDTLLLYTEDTYEVEGEPYFGYMRGRYTQDELKACDDYADMLGIEMIPCIQTLAHLEPFLKWPQAEHLRDTEEVLLVGSERTYAFLDNMLRSATAPFRTRNVHIGMDEAHGLGLGRYMTRNGYKAKHELMKAHLAEVLAITDRLGLKAMMWGDMYFRMSIDGGGYYDPDVELSDHAKSAIVPGVEQIYWDYYHNDQSFYERYLQLYKELGGVPAFCGGVCSWGGMLPNYPKTQLASIAGLNACLREGVRRVMVSMWNDSGEEIVYSGLAGWQLYAEMNYRGADGLAPEVFGRRVRFCTGVDYDDFYAMGAIDDIAGRGGHSFMLESSNPQRYLLWQDILLGLFDKHVEGLDTRGHYGAYAGRMAACAAKYAANREMAGLFELAEKLGSALELKADIGLRLKRAYDAGDKAALGRIAEEELRMLRFRVLQLCEAHRAQWFAAHKPFGWEALELKYGGLLIRIDSARGRILDYVRGTIDAVEELEVERLTYDGFAHDDALGHFNRYTRIVTPNVFY